MREPEVFLFDEPLSNLDAKLRNQMRAEIIKLRQRIDTTFIYVTHDQTEAMTLGDRIVIMRDGYIQQIGTPQQVFDHPENLFVAGFIGTPQMNFFKDSMIAEKNGGLGIEVSGVFVALPEEKQQALRAKGVEVGRKVVVGVRPEHIMLCADGVGIPASVDVSEMLGGSIHLHVRNDTQNVVLVLATVDLPQEHQSGFSYGDRVNYIFGGNVVHIFDPETEKALL